LFKLEVRGMSPLPAKDALPLGCLSLDHEGALEIHHLGVGTPIGLGFGIVLI
jgi:hypothetical protein